MVKDPSMYEGYSCHAGKSSSLDMSLFDHMRILNTVYLLIIPKEFNK